MKKKVLIIGMGVSGRAAADFLLKIGSSVVGVDARIEDLAREGVLSALEKKGVYVFSDKEPINISSFDEIVLSPGISPLHPMIQRANELHIPIIGEAELAFRHLGSRRALAITGTNGKTTVTLLVEHILRSSGYKARALGNVGQPLTQFLDELEPAEILVAELSSYQLETMNVKAFDAAIILNVTPDHLDRYASMEEYARAKCRLQYCLKDDAPFYIFSEMIKPFGHLLERHYITFGDALTSQCWTDGHRISEDGAVSLVMHNGHGAMARIDSLNALAAWLLCKTVGVTAEQFVAALATFKKPSHRIELIRQIDGVAFFDDSKGTNIDAVIHAVQAMPSSVYLIAGGVDKGASYLPWRDAFSGRVKEIFVLGQAAEKIRQELGPFFKVTKVSSLSQAVALAAEKAESGDSVLLSPGCSSFDMFRDYAHRGEEFQKCVSQLEVRSKK